MSDIKFSCPQCQQHIQCDEASYGGREIACPACGTRLVVPGQAAAPAPAPAAAPPYAPPPQPAPAGGKVCPGCGSALPRGAVICTKCGFNLALGQRAQALPGKAGAAAAARAPRPDKWFYNPNVWLGILLVFFGGLYALSRLNPVGLLVFIGVALLYFVAVQIWMLVAAFKDSVGTGFMSLCVPFYGIYFVYSKSESPMLKAFYTISILVQLSFYALKHLTE
jgi:DNA-directed RNA polymerase subunit RPC12/RpoP